MICPGPNRSQTTPHLPHHFLEPEPIGSAVLMSAVAQMPPGKHGAIVPAFLRAPMIPFPILYGHISAILGKDFFIAA